MTRRKEFEAFYRETVGSAGRCVRCLCRDGADAEDLLHESYLAAMNRWDTFSGEGTRRAWLMAIIRNTFLSGRRRRRLRRTVPLEAVGEPAAAPGAAGPDEYADLWRAIDRLEPRHREILILRFAGHLDYAEIARVLDSPVGTVRSRLHRALRELKERIRIEP